MSGNTERPDADSATDVLERTATEGGDEASADDLDAETSGDAKESAAAEDPADGGVKSTLGPRLLAAGAALVVAGSVASAVYFFLQLDEQRADVDARAAASAAACDYARVIANFDYRSLDPYFAGVLDGATGEWKSQFDAQHDRLRDLYASGEVVSQATEVECATISGGRDSADALVVVTESIANIATEGQPQLAQVAMTFTLDNIDGRWLVSKLSAPQFT